VRKKRCTTSCGGERAPRGKQCRVNQHLGALDQQSPAFDDHMANIDRSRKMTQDYILDRSVVRESECAERGTMNNSYAESIVSGDRNRFQIVQNQNLLRGLDS